MDIYLFSGFALTACPKEQADLVFLLDQSGSISPTDYSIMINFTAELVNGFSVSKKNVHVGLAQFSTENKHEFYLNKYDSSSDVIAHIKSLNHSGGGTLIGKALNYIKDYFKPSQGSRAGISKNLVLITDGDSQDNVKPAADLLKNLGIEVFTIGIGNVHDVELLQIAGVRERLFRVENFNGLDQIKSKVVDTICDSKPPRPGECVCVFSTMFLCVHDCPGYMFLLSPSLQTAALISPWDSTFLEPELVLIR